MLIIDKIFGKSKQDKTPQATIDPKEPMVWEEYRTSDGKTGHRISLEKMTPEQISKLENDLNELGIPFYRREATADTPSDFASLRNPVKKGHPALIVLGREGAARLRVDYFGYDNSNPMDYVPGDSLSGTKSRLESPFKFPAADYKKEEKARTESVEDAIARKTDQPEWDQLENGGYRLQLTGHLTDLERWEFEKQLKHANVLYQIQEKETGESFLYVIDPESVENLERRFFKIENDNPNDRRVLSCEDENTPPAPFTPPSGRVSR